jgi:hypothetical protein
MWEFGGLICSSGGYFYPTAPFTDRDGGSVLVPNTACGSWQAVANVHTHTPVDQPYPSGFDPPGSRTELTDIYTADQNPSLVYYMKAPNDIPSPSDHYLRYQFGVGGSGSMYNVFELQNDGTWLHVPYPLHPRPW